MLFALALAIAAAPATATPPPAGLTLGYLEGRDLLARCTSAGALGQDYCFGYIAAVYDSVRAYEAWLSLREMCVPVQTPQGDLKRVVVDHLRANPQHLTSSAASVVVIALAKAYPCATTGTQRPRR